MAEKNAAKRATKKPDGEAEVLAAIALMPGPDRVIGERLHAIIKANAPALLPRTWYGMPAYAKDGKVVCFFRSAQKFKERYMTLGFNDVANLDEGAMWPIYFALKGMTDAEEATVAALVKKAVS
ncbi:MAG: iron chaperone [Acidimicrobiales bacterium]|jgi:uncharacterized protein YdhG (YjbR/CyaY superfamily)